MVLARKKFSAPEPLRLEPTRRDKSIYCEFYKKYDHLTSEYFHLKSEIENLIHHRELKEFVLSMVNNVRASTSQQIATTNPTRSVNFPHDKSHKKLEG